MLLRRFCPSFPVQFNYTAGLATIEYFQNFSVLLKMYVVDSDDITIEGLTIEPF